jgi:outer membrane biosynthesis protein TonB
MLSSTGSLSLPYKIAIVAVMALVACGTLVTFGTAGAETAGSSSDAAALPGTDEASPQVQGQVLPPSQSLLTSQDLLSTLNLTDYSPADTTVVDDSDNSDDDSDNKNNNKKKSTKPAAKATVKPTAKPTAKATTAAPKPTSSPSPKPTVSIPTTPAPEPEPEPSPTPEKKCAQWLGKLCIKWESS